MWKFLRLHQREASLFAFPQQVTVGGGGAGRYVFSARYAKATPAAFGRHCA